MHTYSKGLVASVISNCLVVREARRMTYRSPEEIQIVVYLFCLRDFPWTRRETCARSSFPSEIRRSRSRIQKTRGERENRKKKKGKRKKENKNVEHREKKRMDSGGFALQNPSVKYPRLFRSVYPRDTILSRGKRSDGNRWISFYQERIVCEVIVSRTRVGILSSAQDRCCRGLEIKWDVD